MTNLRERNYHFIAAGGVGMSALAKFLLEKGCKVTGSDISESKYVKMLRNLGAQIFIGQKAENIKSDMTIIVSSAISEENPELKEARRLNLPVLHRSDMLQMISDEFSKNDKSVFFGFSGTHGKTTTSGLCSYVLTKAGEKPSYAVGGIIPEIGDNSKFISDKIFIAELDESDGTIVKYSPDVNIINNLSFDHPDFYKNGMTDIYNTFKKYIDGTSKNAIIVTNADNSGCQEFIKMIENRQIITFGLNNADYTAKNIIFNGFSSKFDIYYKEEFKTSLEMSIPGIHNVYNALAVYAALDIKGFRPERMTEYFKSFSGMGRRFQTVAEFNGIKVIDDYAHHPEEIKTTLSGLKEYKEGRVIAIFQPHRYTRLQGLWNDFLNAFDTVDKLYVTDVYNASEKPIDGINSENFVKDLKIKDCQYISGDMKTVAKTIFQDLKPKDIVITLGAGTVTQIGGYLQKISENKEL
ncbi:UDP-N-acetylmuramate--L-alanine ligase [bacterium]|nr:UDP-N-acetylmuramate--L-alanine ligase [bacterium]